MNKNTNPFFEQTKQPQKWSTYFRTRHIATESSLSTMTVQARKTGNYSYEVESYSLFKNVDISILQLNSKIRKFGYKFICLTVVDFEKRFYDLLSVSKRNSNSKLIEIGEHKVIISIDFYNAYINNSMFSGPMVSNQIILLKRLIDTKRELKNRNLETSKEMLVLGEMQEFSNSLVNQLRLCQSGDILISSVFQIAKRNRHITGRIMNTKPPQVGADKYTLSATQSKIIRKRLVEKFNIGKIAEIAFFNFNLSYDILESKIKFITLMTSLESLFNRGSDQISHLVSRHLSLIVSKDENEFQQHYKRIKELYAIRSKIVHGNSVKGDIFQQCKELQDYVRKAITFCNNQQMSQDQLFDMLNRSGLQTVNP